MQKIKSTESFRAKRRSATLKNERVSSRRSLPCFGVSVEHRAGSGHRSSIASIAEGAEQMNSAEGYTSTAEIYSFDSKAPTPTIAKQSAGGPRSLTPFFARLCSSRDQGGNNNGIPAPRLTRRQHKCIEAPTDPAACSV